MPETTEKKSGWSLQDSHIDVKAHLPWHVHLALWICAGAGVFITAVEAFALYVWLVENPQWWPL